MKISIITPTFNVGRTISDCIASVNNQTYPDIEHIIIDGASTDNTIELIQSQPNRVSILVSEPDHGIYFAMNKGISLAKGDIVGILNGDDYYPSKALFARIAEIFINTNCDCLFGNLDFVSAGNPDKIIRHWRTSEFRRGRFATGWHPPTPTFFIRRGIFEKYGMFDTSLEVSADFELILRFLEKEKIRTVYMDETIVKMRYGGESTGSLKKIFLGNKNIMKAFRKNNIPVSFLYPVYRLVPKLLQFLKFAD